MEISYWQSRWLKENIGWHMDEVYPLLAEFWPRLGLKEGARVLVPLCGKSLDLLWLANQNLHITGVEVSERAVLQFFREHGIEAKKSYKASFKIFRSENIEIWTGDFLKMKPSYLPDIDAIYDKAALIALPGNQREPYAGTLKELCNPHTQIMLNTFEYEQNEMNGPPFAVFKEELEELFGSLFTIDLLHEESIFNKLVKFRQRGLSSYLIEKLYHLRPR